MPDKTNQEMEWLLDELLRRTKLQLEGMLVTQQLLVSIKRLLVLIALSAFLCTLVLAWPILLLLAPVFLVSIKFFVEYVITPLSSILNWFSPFFGFFAFIGVLLLIVSGLAWLFIFVRESVAGASSQGEDKSDQFKEIEIERRRRDQELEEEMSNYFERMRGYREEAEVELKNLQQKRS